MSDQQLGERIEALAGRDDTWVSRELLERYLEQGAWTGESFVHDLERHAAQRPGALAIIDEDGRRTTYGEYEERTRRLANGFLALGLEPGDRVAMQLPNTSVADLVRALNEAKISTRRTIAILQAIKAAGALHAELDIV